jgi:S1-C subfamily serine protease
VITNAGETTGPVNAAESVYVQFADRDRIPASVVGEPVAAIGSPLGNADSLAGGIVSAVHRSTAALTAPSFLLLDAIQTDPPIAHGSSGGPLLDSAGRAIGINAQLRSRSTRPSLPPGFVDKRAYSVRLCRLSGRGRHGLRSRPP